MEDVPMDFQSVIRVLCFTALLAGLACGDNKNNNNDVGPIPPTGLSYAQAEIAATRGAAITPDSATVTGTVTGWSVNPALPNGLSLDATTGVIAGTPVAVSPQATYTVTASNRAGSTDTTLQITVKADLCRDIPALPAAYTDWPALQPVILSDAEIDDVYSEVSRLVRAEPTPDLMGIQNAWDSIPELKSRGAVDLRGFVDSRFVEEVLREFK